MSQMKQFWLSLILQKSDFFVDQENIIGIVRSLLKICEARLRSHHTRSAAVFLSLFAHIPPDISLLMGSEYRKHIENVYQLESKYDYDGDIRFNSKEYWYMLW
ncbi:hypothetical protein GJ496_011374 [Pomphorhynchus laevis]|nr:hypothetical protein GJ496_011374 [Pomphorhynchus laevis]